MERYEKYKDSGIDWLGNIPEHWQRSRAKFVSNIFVPQRNKPELNSDEGIAWLTMEDMISERISTTSLKVTLEAITNAGSKILSKGSVIASCVGNFGVCAINEIDAIINQQLQAFIPNPEKVNIDYFSKLVSISKIYFEIVATAATVVYVNQAGFASMPVILPPLEEQKTIARYLDHKTAEIDRLISQKEKLIALYEEEKTAMINQAVTQGIDRTIKLKPSSIDWLGDIPEHWEVRKLRYLFTIKKRIVRELGFDILSITQRGIKVKNIDSKDGQISSDYSKYQLVEFGDFAMNNMDLLTGFVDIANQEGVTSPDYRVFTLVDDNSESKFFLYLFQLGYMRKIFYGFGRGAALFGRWRFPTDEFNEFLFPVPSLEEQKAIVAYIEKESDRINAKIVKTKRIIELQKEYRTALISEAVTGKIKVF